MRISEGCKECRGSVEATIDLTYMVESRISKRWSLRIDVIGCNVYCRHNCMIHERIALRIRGSCHELKDVFSEC